MLIGIRVAVQCRSFPMDLSPLLAIETLLRHLGWILQE